MAINKVVYGGQTLLDVSTDTAIQSDVLAGKYFHDKTGTRKVGTFSPTGNAKPEEVLNGKTFYANGSKTGVMSPRIPFMTLVKNQSVNDTGIVSTSYTVPSGVSDACYWCLVCCGANANTRTDAHAMEGIWGAKSALNGDEWSMREIFDEEEYNNGFKLYSYIWDGVNANDVISITTEGQKSTGTATIGWGLTVTAYIFKMAFPRDPVKYSNYTYANDDVDVVASSELNIGSGILEYNMSFVNSNIPGMTITKNVLSRPCVTFVMIRRNNNSGFNNNITIYDPYAERYMQSEETFTATLTDINNPSNSNWYVRLKSFFPLQYLKGIGAVNESFPLTMINVKTASLGTEHAGIVVTIAF